jgi:hypothetical protein
MPLRNKNQPKGAPYGSFNRKKQELQQTDNGKWCANFGISLAATCLKKYRKPFNPHRAAAQPIRLRSTPNIINHAISSETLNQSARGDQLYSKCYNSFFIHQC